METAIKQYLDNRAVTDELFAAKYNNPKKTFQVVQSRGFCNQNTPHHNEIINLVNANMNKIRQAI